MIPLVIIALPVIAGIVALISSRYMLSAAATLCAGALDAALAWIWNAQASGAGTSPLIEDDAFSRFLLIVITGVAFLTFAMAFAYMQPRLTTVRDIRSFWGNIALFFAAICAVPLMSHLMFAWIAIELTTLMSVLLVASNGTRKAIAAAWKYALITLAGSSIALFGFLILFSLDAHHGFSTLTWDSLASSLRLLPATPARLGMLCILVGLGTKIGMVPLHTWLPDAYQHAPVPVCILFSGGESTVVAGVLLRLLFLSEGVSRLDIGGWAITFGLLTLGTASFLLLKPHDLTRLFAYSSVEQMGLILIAGGIGSSLAHEAALLQLLGNSFIKAACFSVAGIIGTLYGTSSLSKIHGLARTNARVASLFALASMGILGLPPFMIFLGEFSLFRSGLSQGMWTVMGLVLFFLVVGFSGILRSTGAMLSGEPPSTVTAAPHRGTPLPSLGRGSLLLPGMVIIVSVAIVAVGGLVLPPSFVHLIRSIRG